MDNVAIEDDVRQLVMARLRVIPKNIDFSIGAQHYTTEQLLQHVQEDTVVGKEIVKIQIEYLRDLATGAIYVDE
jgi:hypothetical protein